MNRPIREALLSGDMEAALAELEDLSDDEELVMVCDAGVASTETARQLQDRGRNASALDGGLDTWKNSACLPRSCKRILARYIVHS